MASTMRPLESTENPRKVELKRKEGKKQSKSKTIESNQSVVIKVNWSYTIKVATSRVLRTLLELLVIGILLVWDVLLQTLVDSEPLHSTEGVQNDLLLAYLLDLPGVDHVAHQLGSACIVVSSVLSLLDSVSEGGQLLHVSYHLHLPRLLHLLLFFDLVLGPSTFGAHLEHAGAHALGD